MENTNSTEIAGIEKMSFNIESFRKNRKFPYLNGLTFGYENY